MDRKPWWVILQGVTKESDTTEQLNNSNNIQDIGQEPNMQPSSVRYSYQWESLQQLTQQMAKRPYKGLEG